VQWRLLDLGVLGRRDAIVVGQDVSLGDAQIPRKGRHLPMNNNENQVCHISLGVWVWWHDADQQPSVQWL